MMKIPGGIKGTTYMIEDNLVFRANQKERYKCLLQPSEGSSKVVSLRTVPNSSLAELEPDSVAISLTTQASSQSIGVVLKFLGTATQLG